MEARNAAITWSGGAIPGGYTATTWDSPAGWSVGQGQGTVAHTKRNDAYLYVARSGVAAGGVRWNNSTNNSYLHGNNDWGIRLTNDNGYIQFGPANSSYAHIYSDRAYFYFNQPLQRSGYTVWDSGNLTNVSQLSNDSGYIRDGVAGDYEIANNTNGNESYPYASIELRESNYGASSAYTAPRLSFHWGGVVASQIGIESSGRIKVVNNPGTSYEALIAGSIYGANFYYSSDAGYGIIGTNGYFDTLNSKNGAASDPLELVYYTNSSDIRVGTGTNGNRALYAGGLYDTGSRVLSQRGNSYYQVDTWLQFNGNFGLYFPGISISGYGGTPHFYPNYESMSYGAMVIQGYKNSYTGIYYYNASNTVGDMFDTGGNGGNYDTSTGWHFYWYRGYSCLGIGGSSTASGYRAYTNGAHYVAGNMYATGEVYAYSDRRKKKDIITVDNALNKVLQLRGVYYKRIDNPTENNDDWNPDTQYIGVIAQETEEVVPELVTYNKSKDEYGVSYGNMGGLFIEAFKDLNDMVKEQKEMIENLKAEIEKLKGKV
jgi:hypothetical protein